MCLHLCQILQHEDYSFPSFDVALLYIDGEVDADGVTVDFATLAETDAEDFVGNDCEIAGWGQTDGEQQIIYAILLLVFWASCLVIIREWLPLSHRLLWLG